MKGRRWGKERWKRTPYVVAEERLRVHSNGGRIISPNHFFSFFFLRGEVSSSCFTEVSPFLRAASYDLKRRATRTRAFYLFPANIFFDTTFYTNSLFSALKYAVEAGEEKERKAEPNSLMSTRPLGERTTQKAEKGG